MHFAGHGVIADPLDRLAGHQRSTPDSVTQVELEGFSRIDLDITSFAVLVSFRTIGVLGTTHLDLDVRLSSSGPIERDIDIEVLEHLEDVIWHLLKRS